MRLDKETWEPVIGRLFQYQITHPSLKPIREAWSLDWPNHGESAVLNESVLQDPALVSKYHPFLFAFHHSPPNSGERVGCRDSRFLQEAPGLASCVVCRALCRCLQLVGRNNDAVYHCNVSLILPSESTPHGHSPILSTLHMSS